MANLRAGLIGLGMNLAKWRHPEGTAAASAVAAQQVRFDAFRAEDALAQTIDAAGLVALVVSRSTCCRRGRGPDE